MPLPYEEDYSTRLQYSFCCNPAKLSDSIIHISIAEKKFSHAKIKLYFGGGPEEHTFTSLPRSV